MSLKLKADNKIEDKDLTESANSKDQQHSHTDFPLEVELRSIGVGTMRTSATYAALLIQLEGDRWEQVDVLDSVMEALGISPEEVSLNRQRPDCVDAEEFDRWREAMNDLQARTKGKN